MTRKFWLMKTEPGELSFADVLAMPEQTVDWWGVRNYQARNFMRDEMNVDDGVLFYHSSCKTPGIAGIARIASGPFADRTQFDPASEYFDPKSTPENPRWIAVNVQALKAIELITPAILREYDQTCGMRVLTRGNRLSITPVTAEEFSFITDNLAKYL